MVKDDPRREQEKEESACAVLGEESCQQRAPRGPKEGCSLACQRKDRSQHGWSEGERQSPVRDRSPDLLCHSGSRREPWQGAEQRNTHPMSVFRSLSSCCDNRPKTETEEQAKVINIIQARDKTQDGSHSCHEKWPVSGNTVYLVFFFKGSLISLLKIVLSER